MDQQLINQCLATAQTWLDGNYDEQTKQQVRQLMQADDKSELVDSFYRTLEFGTGGLRGIMGAGTNRMNIYTVGAATQGFANYLRKAFADRKEISVVVCHDCRNNSRRFAEITADIFSANGIHVYLFEDMRPTPEASFAIRHFHCQGGVNITASHNPKEYNGYKAYWEDGAQVLTPHDRGIIDCVNAVKVEDIRFEGNKQLISIIGKEVDEEYLRQVHTLSIDPECIRRQKDLCIVYTPLHGTGMNGIPQSLRLWGFENVHCVPEQMQRSGDFPTVVSPNPENAEVLTLAVNLAKKLDADLVLASDPDADRIAVACKNDKGEWFIVNGNQTCMIFLYYIIENRLRLHKMQGNEYIVKTIVTTEMIRRIAEHNHIDMIDCYTGFKWIAKEIRDHEGTKKYIGGGEESFGFLAQDFVRDKDSVSACSLMAEICAWAKDQGKSLYDLLMDVYMQYGFSKEFTINIVRPGKSGADEIRQMMANYRQNPPREIAGSPVVLTKDYSNLTATAADGTTSHLNMPEPANVLQYFTADGLKVSVRPSGTEPKIKFYLEIPGTMASAADYAAANAAAEARIEPIKKSLGL